MNDDCAYREGHPHAIPADVFADWVVRHCGGNQDGDLDLTTPEPLDDGVYAG